MLLLVVGATASGLAMLVSANAQTMMLNSTVNTDAALVRGFVQLAGLTPGDLQPGQLTPARQSVLQSGLQVLTQSGQLLRMDLLAPDGTVLARQDGAQSVGVTDGMRSAIQGQTVYADIVTNAAAAAPVSLGSAMVVREYVPIILDGQVLAVAGLWRDAAPILAQLEQNTIMVVAVTVCAALVCAVLLWLIFRAAQRRLTRQSRQLLESTRRDPLTQAQNHGAIVESLSLALEKASPEGAAVGLALADIDSFGLFNETYGDAAGDDVIIEVARLLESRLSEGMEFGRYGPDEFLVVASGAASLGLADAMRAVRSDVAELTLRFDSSEKLPVSISVGVCFFPVNGRSATALLSAVSLTLEEARASGGDTLKVGEAGPIVSRIAQTFDILQGLVIAVDTKDHYTRRHSEDVARYADFLAEQLGMDRETRLSLRSAGLLHDIGKIGIPDSILRKPGRLSSEEMGIVSQHVALGDMIVRDLPDIETIRAGVRFHHERWDGRGYLAGLSAEEIPLIARILAIGDAFSAMTTTRPYRKALSVEEALRRLGDAAGTQLDESLVQAFLDGYASAAHPPMPGEAASSVPWLLVPEAA
jgi:diguanylate cyclase (GGDEF)-like protein